VSDWLVRSMAGDHKNLSTHGNFKNCNIPIVSNEKCCCLMITGNTVEKKLIGMDWAM
jgi:hypothetical protein